MVDAGIGRLLISSLHQGIADISPNRLEFYEGWLSPAGMHDGRIGLAPLGAVLSFLHREEPPANDQIVARAGRYAADWTFEDLSAARRWIIRRLPTTMRARVGAQPRQEAGVRHRARVQGEDPLQGHRPPRSTSTPRCSTSCAIRRPFRCGPITRRRWIACSRIARSMRRSPSTTQQPGAWSLAIIVRGPRPLEAVDAA